MEKTLKIVKIIFLLAIVTTSGLWFYWRYFPSRGEEVLVQKIVNKTESSVSSVANKIENQATPVPNTANDKSVNIVVPFTVQAPNGNWSDPTYQNGCEEASALMAMGWAAGKTTIEQNFAEQEIKNISDYETKLIGTYVDTDVDDVAKFMRGYFHYDAIEVKKNISATDIIAELGKGNVVMVPVFGQALNNPHFTSPGPIEHMLVVTGYDAKTKEFITNDPGTKFGAGYRYTVTTLISAIWMYPTSPQTVQYPGSDKALKAMIVVWRL